MSWTTKRWIRRHQRRHTSVMIVHRPSFTRKLIGGYPFDEVGTIATAHCECGATRLAYVKQHLGQNARAAA